MLKYRELDDDADASVRAGRRNDIVTDAGSAGIDGPDGDEDRCSREDWQFKMVSEEEFGQAGLLILLT